jgi:translocation and assembly module TamA
VSDQAILVSRYFAKAALTALVLCAMAGPITALDVTITGDLPDDLRSDLGAASLLTELAAQDDPPPFEIVSAAQADYKRLLGALYARGYFAARVSIRLNGVEADAVSTLTPPAAIARAEIAITPRQVFRFGDVTIAPRTQTDTPDQIVQPGAIAQVNQLQDSVQAALSAWRDQGHAKARIVSQDIRADHRRARLNADIRLDPGPVFTFGALVPAGNESVRTQRIVEMAGLPTGARFDPEQIELATNRLLRSGAFQSVRLEIGDTAANAPLPVIAQVVEAKPRRFGFGAEISNIEGLALSGYWLHRNLLGGAERLRLDGEIRGIAGQTGGEDYTGSIMFERPATLNEDTNFYARSDLEQLNENSFSSRQITLEAGFERVATTQRRYRLGAGLRRGRIRSPQGQDDYALLLFPLGVTFDYKDRPLDARRGYYAAVDLDPFASLRGGDGGLLARADLRGYYSPRPNLTLAMRGQLGSLTGPKLADAPEDFLFFSGGGGTVRGQDYQSLGVTQGSIQTGGRAFAALSAELRMRTASPWGWAAFADVGYVGAESFPDGRGDWHGGAGVGIRYDTGLGPLRLDAAVPINNGSGVHFYVGIGQAF